MTKQKIKNKSRKKYYIDKVFQNRFIFSFSAIILISAFSSLIVLTILKVNPYILPNNAGLLQKINYDKVIRLEKKGDEFVKDEFGSYFIINSKPISYNAFDLYWSPIIFISFLNLLVLIFYSLFFSHKMAGPMFRIKKTLKEIIANKKVNEIKLRKKDQFHDLASLLNEALELKPYEEKK